MARSKPATETPTKSTAKRTPLPKVSQPALRALASAGYDQLEQLAGASEASLLQLHGLGPNAIAKLREALSEIGLSLAVPPSPATITLSQGANDNSRGEKAKSQQTNEIDDYISKCPAEVQKVLRQVRETIREAAPNANEVISYGMPAFRQHGILVYFAAWKKHIGFYPPISGDAAIEKAIAKYAGPKGNLQFPLDAPIPYALIKRIVKLRVKQDNNNHEAKRAKRRLKR